jgi:histidyl-tRNA synthetase
VSALIGRDLVAVSRSVPSAVLVAVIDEESRPASEAVAQSLRSRGIPCEVAPRADKFGKQIKHADRRGIPFVWFPDVAGHSVKDIRSGEQGSADPVLWSPPDADLHPVVSSTVNQEDVP